MRRYVIVGSGVAGISAVEAIRSQDLQAEITLVGDEPHGFYSRPGLAYYLSDEVPKEQLFPYQAEDYRRLNMRWVPGQAVSLDRAEHRLALHNGAASSLVYDRLLLATGAQAARINVPGSSLQGVVKLDNFADAERIIALSRKARAAVVVGGGITALELVEGLRARKVQVTYLLRGDRYWSNVLDETESQIVEQRLAHEGVRILTHAELGEIVGKNGRVAGVVTKDGRAIRCEMVAAAIGIQPRTSLASASGLAVGRGILVDETLSTTDPSVFAAGDAAEVYDPLVGRTILDSLWTPARQQGWAAGLNMAGSTVPYRKGPAFNVTRLAGLTTTIIGTVGKGSDLDLAGIARGDSETWRQLPASIAAGSSFEVNRLRILVGQRTLLGAVVMGDQALSQPIQQLVAAQADITPVRDRLLDPAEKPAEVVLDFWTEWRHLHAA
jgi:NAD(P)H-nitrite reductase large subunit